MPLFNGHQLVRKSDNAVLQRWLNIPGGVEYAGPPLLQVATAEAGVQDRTAGYPFITANNLHLVDKIEVL